MTYLKKNKLNKHTQNQIIIGSENYTYKILGLKNKN